MLQWNEITALVIDDDAVSRRMLAKQLSKRGATVIESGSGEDGLVCLEKRHFNVILLDILLPKMNGFEVLKSIKVKHADVIVIMLTSDASVEGAVKALREGAFDYLEKPFDYEKLEVSIQKAIENSQLKQEVQDLRNLLITQHSSYNNIVGAEGGLKPIVEKVMKASQSDVPALIQGESGTGKELIARAVHFNGSRRDRPFITLNCSAIPDNLLESELFGHEKGAFTGALSQKKGRFERANKGTLFLDEIGDMKLELQAKLLRVLQEQEFERVGGTQTVKVDVRIISATHQDLDRLIDEGKFRGDLYYRLSVYPLSLPPLRERRNDIPSLVNQFLGEATASEGKEIEGMTSEAMEAMVCYDWPGNVRQLQNVVRRAVVDCEHSHVGVEYLPSTIVGARSQSQRPSPGMEQTLRLEGMTPSNHYEPDFSQGMKTMEDYEREILIQALKMTQGDPNAASSILKISRATVYRKAERFDIDFKSFRP